MPRTLSDAALIAARMILLRTSPVRGMASSANMVRYKFFFIHETRAFCCCFVRPGGGGGGGGGREWAGGGDGITVERFRRFGTVVIPY